jgi:hypothetical protein
MSVGPDAVRPSPLRLVPLLWIALSLAWAVIVVVTDRPAWALALWIGTTVGPLTELDRFTGR